MIFGYNTDVKHGDTVYHVQSEARKADLLLQTQVFVRGHCIGKYSSSYAEHAAAPDFSEEHMHVLLKTQHKEVLESVKAGAVEQFLLDHGEVHEGDAQHLGLIWINADDAAAGSQHTLRLLVTDEGLAVDGALLTSRLQFPAGVPIHSQGISDDNGEVELELDLSSLPNGEAVVFVRATHGDKSVTRKFRVKRQQ